MKRYEFYIPIELFNRIKLMATDYKTSMPKMMTYLLEIGYLKMIEEGGFTYEINNK